MPASMRTVVAGGSGFIGRHLTGHLQRAGHHATGCGRDDLLATLSRGPVDILVWAAGTRTTDPEQCLEDHLRAPLRALDAAPALRQLIYLSSGEVYGVQEVPFTEDLPLLGQHPYARAKIAAEQALVARAAASDLALTILRLPVVYGPGQRGPMLVPSLCQALAAGQRFPMTRGEQTRDLLFIDDLCALTDRVIEARPASAILNAGSGREIAILDIARTIARALGREHLLDIGALPYRPEEQMRYALDPARARALLGWQAEVSFAEGVDRLFADDAGTMSPLPVE
jgi:nucleoside-diphosphate-sugar epimerase